MTDVKKMEKQRTRMNPGQEDYNEGNKLTSASGMKLLCSQTPMCTQHPQGHTNCSWHSEWLPRTLAVWHKPHKCPGTFRLGLKMLSVFQHPAQRVGSAALPACSTFSSYCSGFAQLHEFFSYEQISRPGANWTPGNSHVIFWGFLF